MSCANQQWLTVLRWGIAALFVSGIAIWVTDIAAQGRNEPWNVLAYADTYAVVVVIYGVGLLMMNSLLRTAAVSPGGQLHEGWLLRQPVPFHQRAVFVVVLLIGLAYLAVSFLDSPHGPTTTPSPGCSWRSRGDPGSGGRCNSFEEYQPLLLKEQREKIRELVALIGAQVLILTITTSTLSVIRKPLIPEPASTD
jgi:hypothetical protein